jgi:hypothetical protein
MVDDLDHYEFNPDVWDETLQVYSDEEEQQLTLGSKREKVEVDNLTTLEITREQQECPKTTTQSIGIIEQEVTSNALNLECNTVTSTAVDVGSQEDMVSEIKLTTTTVDAGSQEDMKSKTKLSPTAVDVGGQDDMNKENKLAVLCTTATATIDVDMDEDEDVQLLSNDPTSGASEYPIPTVEQDNETYRHGYIITVP